MRNRPTMFTTRDDRADGHMFDFTLRKRGHHFSAEITRRAYGHKVLTTLSQEEIDDLARQLDKWRSDGVAERRDALEATARTIAETAGNGLRGQTDVSRHASLRLIKSFCEVLGYDSSGDRIDQAD